MKKWIRSFFAIALIMLFAIMAVASGSKNESGETEATQKTETQPEATKEAASEADATEVAATEVAATEAPTPVPEKDIYVVGDTYEDSNLRIVYMSSGVYEPTNSYYKPADGNQYIFLRFYVENIGKTDQNISYYDFDCYADGYSCEQFYFADDGLSATLSPGRTTTGTVCFEVPKTASEVEIEFEVNILTDKKIKFAYEGEKDSGYVPENNTTETEDAYKPGDVAETSSLKITYVSAEETTSDNMFVQPKEGCRFLTFTFEFENISSSDVVVSAFSFDCYADGAACEASYYRDDNLSTVTLSAGRKAQGTVTFEVPISAEIIEVEYDEMSLFGKRIVFSYQES